MYDQQREISTKDSDADDIFKRIYVCMYVCIDISEQWSLGMERMVIGQEMGEGWLAGYIWTKAFRLEGFFWLDAEKIKMRSGSEDKVVL
ncbi:hypothetical protein TRV_01832 [Trichophyton verrucosum HKI 0517]|uniref:Uncharacterized protein n=1 Tax=Trichophyton verrucosum (strain HKI 0517) TaxID=663202 RepID=D4D419_TRIVH|nr:uncharacterized protein TRV_01832 [Trichophyton verrucosum HKI 0517]EFE43447.1 hypothetical protein TRV_01832 [Trichophyton verrucosum HKI 0517]